MKGHKHEIRWLQKTNHLSSLRQAFRVVLSNQKKKKWERYKGNFKFKFYSHTKTRKKKIGKIILWNEFCLTQYIQISIWYIINIKIIDKLFLHSFFILSLSNLVCISYFLDMSILTCHIPSVPQLCITHG